VSALLQGRSISRHFGGLRAVESVDFRLSVGEIFGLIGPNGAGKTTLFSVVAGSIRPTAGEVVLDGKQIGGWPAHRVVHAGICRTHQVVRPFARLSVLENVLVAGYVGGGRLRRDRAARAEALGLLEFVGLGERLDSLPGELTLAGRKRLEMARALATGPRVLLLDEVVAGLNPTEAQGMAALIRHIRERRGISIMMIEHVMQAVMGLSDRVMVLDEGRKISEGTPQEVANDPEVIKAYLGEDYLEDPGPRAAKSGRDHAGAPHSGEDHGARG
jgi:branched-chain amino acid transport system ATP-binding protein